ncbi:hypothetical protein NPIL_423981 [Nephila pilipes]|uniref:Uncharacterized protein n=1 Tax=Nephila pilipes TaxID=299642 RepID=A0A8X6TT41_NEPPI|nr:hypothetical protein NPIL_423981 [Nephila pilipes]
MRRISYSGITAVAPLLAMRYGHTLLLVTEEGWRNMRYCHTQAWLRHTPRTATYGQLATRLIRLAAGFRLVTAGYARAHTHGRVRIGYCCYISWSVTAAYYAVGHCHCCCRISIAIVRAGCCRWLSGWFHYYACMRHCYCYWLIAGY